MFGLFNKKKTEEVVKPKREPYDPFKKREYWSDHPRDRELTDLANREIDIKYRQARGHNVTKQELIKLRDDCAAFDKKWDE